MPEWTLHEEPHRHYKCDGSWNGAAKQRIASVTQVLDGDNALVNWATGQTLVAAQWVVDEFYAPAVQLPDWTFAELAHLSGLMPDQIRDAKGASGTAIHQYFYAKMTGAAVLPDAPYGLRQAVDGWLADARPECIEAESIVGCRRRAIAGTFDALVELDDGVHLLDLKQSNSLHPKHFAQLAAYLSMRTTLPAVKYLSLLHIDDCGNHRLRSIAVGSPAHLAADAYFDGALAQHRTAKVLKKVLA